MVRLVGSSVQVLGMLACWLGRDVPELIAAAVLVALGDAFRSGADEALLYRTCTALGREDDFQRIEARTRAAGLTALVGLLLAGGLMLRDAAFSAIVERDLTDGIHQNPTHRPDWFTTAYFHRPEEIPPEIEEAGLGFERTIAIEGPGWVNEDLDVWLEDAAARERLLHVLRRLETEPSLIGASAHLIAVARK